MARAAVRWPYSATTPVSRSAYSCGSRIHGSDAVAISGWVASMRWSSVEPLRGSENRKTGRTLTRPPPFDPG